VAGADVWVTSSAPEKIKQAQALGAKGGFNYTSETWSAEAVKTAGAFDVIVDSAGGAGFEALIDLAAPGGRIVFFGATRGNPPLLPMRKIFWRQLSLLGTTMGGADDWAAMVDFVNARKIKPVVSALLPLEHAEEAFALMERGGQFGKIVLAMPGA
jgi:NADPH:quinone reductase-like Zn-dependent oxidoreductase